MANARSTKKSLLLSALSLMLCFAMLIGTTFAWFTDSVTSANNVITSGNLDIELEYWNGEKWVDVKGKSDILTNTLWEPGVTEVAYLKVKNAGSLALKYQLGVNIASETAGVNVAGDSFLLSDYIMFGVVEGVNGETGAYANREDAVAAVNGAKKISAGYSKTSSMLSGDEFYLALVVYMPTTVGNEANHNGTDVPKIELGINVLATQYTYEDDSFDNTYDAAAFEEISLFATKEGEEPMVMSLADLSAHVSAGEDFSGWTITLTKDIDFGGAEWTPIGVTLGQDLTADGSAVFSGMLDGNGHTLSNFKVTEGVTYGGRIWASLFTGIYAKDGNTAGVKNLTLENVEYNNPDASVGAIVNIADSDGNSSLEFSNIKISGKLCAFGGYGTAGLATLMFGSEVNVENVDLDVDIYIPETFNTGYKFLSPCIAQIALRDNGHITLTNVDYSDSKFYYPSACKLEDRGTVVSGYNSIWVYNAAGKSHVLGCGGYSGQFYDFGVTYTINGVDYTHADLKKGQKDVPGYMYDYIIRPDAFIPYGPIKVTTADAFLKALDEIEAGDAIDATGVEITISDQQYNFDGGITIIGATITTNSRGGSYLISTTGGDVTTFENCVFKRGETGANIIAANADGADLVFNNCTFEGPVMSNMVDKADGKITFNNCTFKITEDAIIHSGYVNCMGGTHEFNGCTFDFTGGSMSGSNQYVRWNAVNSYSERYSTAVILDGCTFINCGTQRYGSNSTLIVR